MRRIRTTLAVLALLTGLAGCLGPVAWEPPVQAFSLTLHFTEPADHRSAGRLLLANARTVEVVVFSGSKEVSRKSLAVEANRSSIRFDLSLQAQTDYVLKASARDANKKLVFYGETEFSLDKTKKASLALLPVQTDDQGEFVPWPTLKAADQPIGVGLGDLGTLAEGASTSYLVDFGDTATGFTLAPTDPTLSLYVQTLEGTAVALGDDRLVTPDDLDGDTQFVLTYYQAGTTTLAPLGTFTIPLDSFTLTGPASLAWGKSGSLAIVASPVNASGQAPTDFTWTTSDATIMAVDTLGNVTAGMQNGTATLTATLVADTTLTATLTVESVKVPVTSVTMNQTAVVTIDTGKTFALSATVLPADATNPALTWSSSNPALATVDSDGTVHALKPGSVTITATSVSEPTLAATATVVLAGTDYQIRTAQDGVWQPLKTTPAGAIALAGSKAQLWILTSGLRLFTLVDGVWEAPVPDVPDAEVRWLAVDDQGTLYAASAKTVYRYDFTGGWTKWVAAPSAGLSGLAFAKGSLWGWSGTTLTVLQGGVWEAGAPVPVGSRALGGSGATLSVLAGTAIQSFDGTGWSIGPAVPDTALAVTSAFSTYQILDVR